MKIWIAALVAALLPLPAAPAADSLIGSITVKLEREPTPAKPRTSPPGDSTGKPATATSTGGLQMEGGSEQVAKSLGSVTGSASYSAHPAGDIDGDGADDLITYELMTYEDRPDGCTHAFTGRRGIDGASLWTSPVMNVPCAHDGGTYVLWHLAEDLTGDRKADILAVVPAQGERIYPIPTTGECWQFAHVVLFSGSDGARRWTWKPEESLLSAQSCHNRNSVSVMPDATGDGVQDVFVTIEMDTLTRQPYWLAGVTLNGTDGTEAGRVATVNRSGESKLIPVEDVSGDRLADIVGFTHPVGDSMNRLTAWSHRGETHWAHEVPADRPVEGLSSVELTGDGLGDIIVYGGDSGPGFWLPFSLAVDGSDGSDLWETGGYAGVPIGDADGDAGTDLLYWRNHFEGSRPGSRRGSLWTVSGKSGATVWGPVVYPEELGGAVGSATADVDADGVDDIVLYVPAESGLRARTLNGTDGSLLWEASVDPGFEQSLEDLGGDVSGDGREDLALVDKHLASSTAMTVSVLDGSDGTRLWAVSGLRVLPWGSEAGWTSVRIWSADLEGDGSEAVIAETVDIDYPVYRRGAVTATSDGRVLWRLSDEDA